ncbi:MAG TPA: hypothetical protein VMV56_07490 [Williamwhitmania sp.]|nr:hypothetical protein [Williamwhitmania sp.]
MENGKRKIQINSPDSSAEAITPEINLALKQDPGIIKITSNPEAHAVGQYVVELKKIRARIEEFFKPEIDMAYQLHKNLIAKKNQVDEQPKRAEFECRNLILDWDRREQKRLAAEQKRLDDFEKQKAIRHAEKEENPKLVEKIITGQVPIVSARTAAPVEKVQGISTRETWKAEVVNKMMLIKAVASGKVPMEYLDVNMSALNKVMAATKGAIVIPGVTSKKESGLNIRSN